MVSKLYNSHTMHYQHTLNGIVQVADAAEAQLAMRGLLTVMIGHTTSWDAPCQKQ